MSYFVSKFCNKIPWNLTSFRYIQNRKKWLVHPSKYAFICNHNPRGVNLITRPTSKYLGFIAVEMSKYKPFTLMVVKIGITELNTPICHEVPLSLFSNMYTKSNEINSLPIGHNNTALTNQTSSFRQYLYVLNGYGPQYDAPLTPHWPKSRYWRRMSTIVRV